MKAMIHRGAVIQRLMIVGLIVLIFALLAGGLYFMAKQPTGDGPDTVAPMQEDGGNRRTGALLDPNREVRGIWIPSVLNITYPSEPGLDASALRAELDAIVKTARDANLNTICLQVRPSSDALYASELFPTSAYLSGSQGTAADGGFDPLAYLCEIAADETDGEALAVYAWVNPLRVTSAGQDPSMLAENNPAVQHPEWTFTYNNAVYYDAGIPEVRELVAAGVREICENYPVAGVIFDDYFYPYPAYDSNNKLLSVDDADTYAAYGGAFDDIGDFRRDNVNRMVQACYEAVKSVSDYIRFGIAPFGIWQNADGENGGSNTAGMEAYSAIYCDALAWMEGGYIDFIAPQIYWQFSTSVARYDTLVRWWNAQCDVYGIPLWISHAIYNYESWATPGEMRDQIGFARAELSYRGSLFYGYPQLLANTGGVTDEIRASFEASVLYFDREVVADTAAEITVTVPYNHFRYDEDGTYLLGQSNPAEPLYCNGVPVSRTRSGYFSFYTPLTTGENSFVFTQGDESYTHTVWKGMNRPQEEDTTAIETETEAKTESAPVVLQLQGASPAQLTAVPWRDGIAVSVTATAGAAVSVRLGEIQLSLTPGETRADGTAVYTGHQTPGEVPTGEASDLGTLSFRAVYGEQVQELIGAQLYALGDGAVLPVTVTEDGTSLKVSPTSWYYDDYIPASAGMTAYTDRIEDGFAQLSLAGNTAYLDVGGITVADSAAAPLGPAVFGAPTVTDVGEETRIVIPSTQNIPVNCVKEDTVFRVTLYRGYTDANTAQIGENPFLTAVSYVNGGEDEGMYTVYTFSLKERDRFYGFRVVYEDDAVVIVLRNPLDADLTAEQPLAGIRIVLDAGHGGSDTGTLTPGTHLLQNEKDCNLAIVLALQPMLRELGAEVILLREDDSTVDIYTRMDAVDEIEPDLLLSIHQNSMPQNSDITHIRGVVGLYWTESGRSLADCVAEEIADALGRRKRDTTRQRLAMLRNYKFPSALIEVGFVTSAEEFEALTAPGGYEITARAICDGVLAWLEAQQM